MEWININDFFRDENLKLEHQLIMGDLVEVRKTGARAFIVFLYRDCDGTPLYSLSLDKNDTKKICMGFGNPSWSMGYSEESLELIKR